MVLIHLKIDEDKQFLAELPAAMSCDEVTRQLAQLHNMRLRVHRLASACDDLIKYGVAKEPSKQQELDIESYNDDGPKDPNADPTGRREGKPCSPELGEIVRKAVAEAEAVISKTQVERKVLLTKEAMTEAMDRVRGAIMIAYPAGLPEWDVVREILEDRQEIAGTQASQEVYDPETSSMWWAGKQLFRDKKLADFVGKNDKTKIVAKLTKKGSGAPARESAITPDMQKDLMSYYYKKQEELKKIDADDEDAYLNSAWANPRGMKQAFSGIGDVSWRPR